MIYIRSFFSNIAFFSTMGIGCILTLFVGPISRKGTIYLWDKIMMPTTFWIVQKCAGLKLEDRKSVV